MKTIEQEINRIKSELADLGCYTMSGKNISELVEEIILNILREENKK